MRQTRRRISFTKSWTFLAESGAQKLAQIEARRTATVQEYLQDWSQEFAEAAARTLKKLTESLKHSARAKAAGPRVLSR